LIRDHCDKFGAVFVLLMATTLALSRPIPS
jgi:hypothetical protein